MGYRKQFVAPVFILALFTLMTGPSAKAGLLDFTRGIGGQEPGGNAGSALNFLPPDNDPTVTILANFGFQDNDPLSLTAGVETSSCGSINCGTVYWGPLGIGANPTGLGVQNDLGTDTPTPAIDNNEALIFFWQDPSILAGALRFSLLGLPPGSQQVHVAALFSGSDGSAGYDYNGSILLTTSTFDVSAIQELAGHNLGLLAIYSNSDSGNVPFGVTSLQVVPEPGAGLLVITGLALGLFSARRRGQAKP